MSRLCQVKASAGSGKTYELTRCFLLRLMECGHTAGVAASPACALAPEGRQCGWGDILAVTFTNAAAAEMRERVIRRLKSAALGMRSSDLPLDADEARRWVDVIMRDLSALNIRTIDSLLHLIVRAAALELNLHPDFQPVFATEEALTPYLELFLERAWRDDAAMRDLLRDACRALVVHGRSKGFLAGEKLLRQLRDLLDDVLLGRFEDLTPEPILKGKLQEMDAAATRAARELLTAAQAAGLRWKKPALGAVEQLAQGRMDKCSSAFAVKETPEELFLKGAVVPQEAARAFAAYAANARRRAVDGELIVQALRISPFVRLARALVSAFLQNQEQEGALPGLLVPGLAQEVLEGERGVPEALCRLGTRLTHFLVDEFQDTSREQWQALRPLVEEALSRGGSLTWVGDVKQSIYRWRNGDWGILNGLNDRIEHFPIKVKTLATNRRSETNIIRFNNQIFTAAVNYLNEVYKKQLGKDCDDLQKAYADVVQESPRSVQKGYVKATFLEPDEAHDYTDQTLISLGEEVEHLLSSGVRLNDIAILVRKNKSIPRIADYFDKELHYKIVSDEAFRLDASLAICMMIDALRFLSDESNKIARAQLAIAYQNEVLQKNLDWNTLLLLPIENYLPPAFLEKQKELRLMPLYELLEELFSIFEMSHIEEQDAYLFAFFDAVTDYLQSNSSELDGFIRYWDETLCSKTIPSGEVEGIRIFSIHKSKGLEFHTVLLPFCDWKLENETNNQLVWCAPQEAPFNAMDILPINYSTQMAESIYGNDYLLERLQLWVDNLNLLYVAFTRAGKNLIIWSKKGQKGTMSELLANTLPVVALKEGLDWEEDCYEQGELCPSEEEKAKTSTNKLTQKPDKLPVHMESMRHEIEFRQSNRSADFIQGIEEEESDDRFIHRGRMLHTLFSAIETAEDIDPAIERLIFEGVIASSEKAEEIREVARKAFSSPEIQDWYSGEWTLFNECAIIYKEKGVLQTRRPDRVMMKDGQVVVVDFKFGKENLQYNKQVKGYMQLLTKMGYKNITGYLWYVDEELIVKVK